MKKTRTLLPAMAVAVLMVFGMFFISSPGFAAECQTPWEPIADVYIEPDGITWVPRVSYALMEVTISRPDGTIFHRVFESGETPRASLSEILGDGQFDCSYIYELRVIPDLNFKKREGDEVEIRYSERALVQNGAFTVYQGEIVVPGEPENDGGKSGFTSNAQDNLSGVQDFVINDDLIVDGSACIGFDCVNGESFGFDTLRLKEHNLRIKFDDTSTAASYPRNDWQLTANDSANGGASKFSIDDISGNRTPFTVEANARSHSLYVDDGGRIGIRTSTPSTEIHVIDGDTPTLRLQQ
ncbi:MAG: TrbC/VirB2 family protein, partial [Candidatus Aminicenantes bacterium]